MSRQLGSIAYGRGTIEFTFLRLRRKTAEIAVHPDMSVVVKAPLESDTEEILRRVRKRAGWIKRQMRYFEQFEPRTPPRRYVGGESHPYLGRQYRLKIRKSNTRRISLKNGYFHVRSPGVSPAAVRTLLEAWYDRKAVGCFHAVFQVCWERFRHNDIAMPSPTIRKMKTRWGSLSKNGVLALNPDLIKVPRECIEYVVMHELCHLLHRHHNSDFYRLLDRTLPDWVQRKQKLETALA